MTFVVGKDCINCKHTTCVQVCPVDCFYEGKNILVIDPEECIDCGLCEPECPVDAIFAEDEVPADQLDFIEINEKYSNDQKKNFITMAWEIARADNTVDKHEEHRIRKLSELLYVDHKDFIKSKISTQ